MINTKDLLENAVKNVKIYIDFDIELANQIIPCRLYKMDPIEMSTNQKALNRKIMESLVEKGYDSQPIDEIEFERQLKALKDPEAQERAKKNKPVNYAEQLARSLVGNELVKTVICEKLYFVDNGEEHLFAKDEDSRKNLIHILNNDPGLYSKIFEKYAELHDLGVDIEEAAKNFSSNEKTEPTKEKESK